MSPLSVGCSPLTPSTQRSTDSPAVEHLAPRSDERPDRLPAEAPTSPADQHIGTSSVNRRMRLVQALPHNRLTVGDRQSPRFPTPDGETARPGRFASADRDCAARRPERVARPGLNSFELRGNAKPRPSAEAFALRDSAAVKSDRRQGTGTSAELPAQVPSELDR